MRTSTPRVAKYNGSETSAYVVEGLRVNGKRTRKFFKKRRAAEAWLRKTLARISKEGEGAIHMPEQLRVDAMACAERLKPYGKTLHDATDHYLAHLAAVSRSCTVYTASVEYQKAKELDGGKESALKDKRLRLERFEEDFGDKMVCDIQAAQVDDWLRTLTSSQTGKPVAKQTRKNYRTVLHGFFKYAAMKKYTAINPVAETSNPKVGETATETFTPAEILKLLENAPADYVPYLAIGAFAGLRASEIVQLDWSCVDLARRQIFVKAEKTKSAKRRYVKILDNLAAWLAPHAKKAGPVMEYERERVARVETCKAAKVVWKDNALRHSFGSNHLAHFEDAPMLAAQMGHTSTRMIYQHYRDVVHPDDAAQWWQVMPPAGASNVVEFGT
jgi:integrase